MTTQLIHPDAPAGLDAVSTAVKAHMGKPMPRGELFAKRRDDHQTFDFWVSERHYEYRLVNPDIGLDEEESVAFMIDGAPEGTFTEVIPELPEGAYRTAMVFDGQVCWRPEPGRTQ